MKKIGKDIDVLMIDDGAGSIVRAELAARDMDIVLVETKPKPIPLHCQPHLLPLVYSPPLKKLNRRTNMTPAKKKRKKKGI